MAYNRLATAKNTRTLTFSNWFILVKGTGYQAEIHPESDAYPLPGGHTFMPRSNLSLHDYLEETPTQTVPKLYIKSGPWSCEAAKFTAATQNAMTASYKKM